jgi:dipeptidyl aminopeptidase/acylaminoacyl peptidase
VALRRLVVSAVAGAALAIAAFIHPTVAPVETANAGPAQPASLVAFQSDRRGDSEIWAVSDDGSEPRQLTDNPNADATPAWTPDGRSIVFASDRGGNWDLYKMNADGSGVQRLTFTKADEFDPVVSPDGQRVAFESDAQGNWDIYVLNLSTGDQVNVSRSVRRDQDPTWAPDPNSASARIAYTTVFNRTNSDLAVVRTNAPGRVQTIVSGSTNDFDANWSRDDQIVFTRRAGATRDLFVVDSDGTNLRDVSTGSTDDWGAVWADNGNILFVRETDPLARAEPYRIWVMNGDGSGQHQLVQGGHAGDVEPAPQPGSNPRFVSGSRTRSLAGALDHCRSRFGNDNANTIQGTAMRDCLYGRGAADKLHGKRAGDPVLRGGPGADRLYGWEGDDRLYGVDGEPDLVRGGPGGDECWVDEDIDTVVDAAIH